VDLDVGQAVWLSQIEPVATALERPLSQKTVVTGLLKVRHTDSGAVTRLCVHHMVLVYIEETPCPIMLKVLS